MAKKKMIKLFNLHNINKIYNQIIKIKFNHKLNQITKNLINKQNIKIKKCRIKMRIRKIRCNKKMKMMDLK